jgi:hypothetical protein
MKVNFQENIHEIGNSPRGMKAIFKEKGLPETQKGPP